MVLVFLVALQLPKSLLHHHDHEQVLQSEGDQDVESIYSEDCLVCQLTIDSFDGPMVPIRIKNGSNIQKITHAIPDSLWTDKFLAYELRGPPLG